MVSFDTVCGMIEAISGLKLSDCVDSQAIVES